MSEVDAVTEADQARADRDAAREIGWYWCRARPSDMWSIMFWSPPIQTWYAYNGMGMPSKMLWEIDERRIERAGPVEVDRPTIELNASPVPALGST